MPPDLCDRLDFTLAIYPAAESGLTHADVSRRVGLEPTSGGDRGDRVPFRHGTRARPRTNWFLSSEEGLPGSKDFRQHVDWTLDRIRPAVRAIRELHEDGSAEVQLRAVWWAGGTEPADGPALRSDQLRDLAALGVELQFDFKDYSDDG